MSQYNRNDFYPRTGDEIDSNGNVKNQADGFDTDGTQFVKGRSVGPTLIDTIPYSTFTASTTLYRPITGKLTRNAKNRTFIVYNNLDQDITGASLSPFDSAVGGGKNGEATGAKTFQKTAQIVLSYTNNSVLAANVDSIQANLPMGSTAPTTGNVYIYVTEVF